MARNDTSHNQWIDVYRGISADISSGALEPGSELPTLAALARREDLTTHGARRVMNRLCEKGLAQGWQGKGYRVALPQLRVKISEKRPVFGDRVRDLGYVCTSDVVSANTKGAPRSIAKQFHRRPGTRVLVTETLRKVAGRPLAVSIDFFPQERLDGLDISLRETGSVSKSLARHGVDFYQREHTTLRSRLPNAHEALLLEISRQQPVYETLGTNIDKKGDVVQVSKGVWRADCVIYDF